VKDRVQTEKQADPVFFRSSAAVGIQVLKGGGLSASAAGAGEALAAHARRDGMPAGKADIFRILRVIPPGSWGRA